MKKLVAFFEIPASDFKRAVNFYEKVFNLSLAIMEYGSEKMAFFPNEDGICPGAISYADNFKPSSDGVLISLNVDDMGEALLAVEENEGRITHPKTKIEDENRGYFSLFIDSEGNRIGLYSDK